MKKYFNFKEGEELITALVVGSKTATAKLLLYVSEQTDGETIYRIIKFLDRKIRGVRQKYGKGNTHG